MEPTDEAEQAMDIDSLVEALPPEMEMEIKPEVVKSLSVTSSFELVSVS